MCLCVNETTVDNFNILLPVPANGYNTDSAFQDSNQWMEALRVCKEYLPHKLSALQDEYDRTVLSRGSHDAQTLMNQARQWEESGEYSRAVECYIKVSRLKHSTNQHLICDSFFFYCQAKCAVYRL